MERLLRVSEAAERTSLSRSKFYELLQAGEIPAVKIGSARRVPERALDAWIAAQYAGQPRNDAA